MKAFGLLIIGAYLNGMDYKQDGMDYKQELEKYSQVPAENIHLTIIYLEAQLIELRTAPEGLCRWHQIEVDRLKRICLLEKIISNLRSRMCH